jgi:two-component system nitrate/nitrite response regulator NarL
MLTPTSPAIRLLLVEDHGIVRAGLCMLIESQSQLTLIGEAANRAEALALAAREQPDVILLDLDLDGEVMLDNISALHAVAEQARVIVLTGVRDPEIHRRAVRLGAVGLVPKEQAADVLLRAIAQVHAGEAWLEPALVASVLGDMSRAQATRQDNAEQAKIMSLTGREREVIGLLGEGLKNKNIADRLFISEATVRHHLTAIFAKLGVADRLELVIYAYQQGLVKLIH